MKLNSSTPNSESRIRCVRIIGIPSHLRLLDHVELILGLSHGSFAHQPTLFQRYDFSIEHFTISTGSRNKKSPFQKRAANFNHFPKPTRVDCVCSPDHCRKRSRCGFRA